MTDEKLSVIKTVSVLPPKSIGYGISAAISDRGTSKSIDFRCFLGPVMYRVLYQAMWLRAKGGEKNLCRAYMYRWN